MPKLLCSFITFPEPIDGWRIRVSSECFTLERRRISEQSGRVSWVKEGYYSWLGQAVNAVRGLGWDSQTDRTLGEALEFLENLTQLKALALAEVFNLDSESVLQILNKAERPK